MSPFPSRLAAVAVVFLPIAAQALEGRTDAARLEACVRCERTTSGVASQTGIAQMARSARAHVPADGWALFGPVARLGGSTETLSRVATEGPEPLEVASLYRAARALIDGRRMRAETAIVGLETLGSPCGISEQRIGPERLTIAHACAHWKPPSAHFGARYARLWADELRTPN